MTRPTYPTLTQVPPNLLLSMAIVFAPCCALALRAQAKPPLPPPMTRKSHSLVTGAMFAPGAENCREREESLEVAVFEVVLGTERVKLVSAFMRRGGKGFKISKIRREMDGEKVFDKAQVTFYLMFSDGKTSHYMGSFSLASVTNLPWLPRATVADTRWFTAKMRLDVAVMEPDSIPCIE
jgi:hypothetical protein